KYRSRNRNRTTNKIRHRNRPINRNRTISRNRKGNIDKTETATQTETETKTDTETQSKRTWKTEFGCALRCADCLLFCFFLVLFFDPARKQTSSTKTNGHAILFRCKPGCFRLRARDRK